MDSGKTRVAILGGGVGGMTAAYELTQPEHEGRYEVTVHQLGWRLGGKGASGRNAAEHDRIEEHGLHLWFGFYAHAFAMMNTVYGELGRKDGMPLAGIDDAFSACPEVVVYDRINGVWDSVATQPPVRGGHPWETEPETLPMLFTVAVRALRQAHGWLTKPGSEDTPAEALAEFEAALAEAEALEQTESLGDAAVRAGLGSIVERCRRALASLEASWHERIDTDMPTRQFFTTVDVLVAAGKGLLDREDDVIGGGFEAIDKYDLAKWLERHGASATTIGDSPAHRAPILRSIYDVAFLYPNGRVDAACGAAGTALSDLLKMMFTYRGAIAYKMNAGMGDAIFAPLYEVLVKRGVKFEFFHAVSELRCAAGRVSEIDIIPQAEVDGYEPLEPVGDLPCWPSQPRWDQLPPEAKKAKTRFETELDPLGRKAQTLTLKVECDFDKVVLAIPVGAHELVCGPLIKADARFAEMVAGACTVPTQAFQLWTTRTGGNLGYKHRAESIATCFVEPLDTYCDMAHLLPRESWPADRGILGLAYVCGVLEDEGDTHEQATERVKRNMESFIQDDLQHVWKNAGRDPSPMIASAYWRANVVSWEKYVTTPAGSVKHRLRSDKSGLTNMVMAGDWTENGINGGCVEAAVISGMRAVRGLAAGGGESDHITGEGTHWLTEQNR